MTWEDGAYFAHTFSLYIGSLWQLDEGGQTGGIPGGGPTPATEVFLLYRGYLLGSEWESRQLFTYFLHHWLQKATAPV